MPDGVADVLKGWPRISELFIASDVHRVEQAGAPLPLYVIEPPVEERTHPVAGRIRARPEHLPATTSLRGTTLAAWLRASLPAFPPALRRTARRHPRGLDAPDVRPLHDHFARGATTVTWLCSAITGLPFSFTGHAKDISSPSRNPAGLLRRKLLAARFAVTRTAANVRHLKAIAPEAAVHRAYHGLNAGFARLMGEERGAQAPDPDGSDGRRRGAVRLVGVGRLVPRRGFDVMVAEATDATLFGEAIA